MNRRWAFTNERHEYVESETKPAPQACDFCGKRGEALRIFATAESILPDFGAHPPMASEAGWAACRVCAELIDREQWERLLLRAVDEFIRYHPDAARFRPLVRNRIAQIQASFRAARKGAM